MPRATTPSCSASRQVSWKGGAPCALPAWASGRAHDNAGPTVGGSVAAVGAGDDNVVSSACRPAAHAAQSSGASRTGTALPSSFRDRLASPPSCHHASSGQHQHHPHLVLAGPGGAGQPCQLARPDATRLQGRYSAAGDVVEHRRAVRSEGRRGRSRLARHLLDGHRVRGHRRSLRRERSPTPLTAQGQRHLGRHPVRVPGNVSATWRQGSGATCRASATDQGSSRRAAKSRRSSGLGSAMTSGRRRNNASTSLAARVVSHRAVIDTGPVNNTDHRRRPWHRDPPTGSDTPAEGTAPEAAAGRRLS